MSDYLESAEAAGTEVGFPLAESAPSPTPPQRCSAICNNGKPCSSFAVAGDGLCVFHSPSFLEARRRGGFNSSRVARLDKKLSPRLRPILDLVERAIRETHDGTLPASRGSAIAALVGALVKCLEAAEFEVRLEQIEEKFTRSEGSNGMDGKAVTVSRRTSVRTRNVA